MVNPIGAATGFTSLCICALSYMGYFFYQHGDNNLSEFNSILTGEDYDMWASSRDPTKSFFPPWIHEITSDNYLLLNESNWFVNIYAPWSYWSKSFEPTWEELPRRMYQLHPRVDIKFASVDGHKYPNIAAWMETIHYPSLRLIRDGTMRTFNSDNKTLEALEEYLLGGWQSQQVRIQLENTWSIWFELQIRIWNYLCIHQVRIYEFITESVPQKPWICVASFILSVLLIWLTLAYTMWLYRKLKSD